MSHITKIKTKLKDGHALRHALKNLYYHINEGGMVKGLTSTDDEYSVLFRGIRDDITLGFRISDMESDCYEILGDWPEIKCPQEEIVNEIIQAYSVEKVIRLARSRGYSIVRNTQNSGRQEILLRKVA